MCGNNIFSSNLFSYFRGFSLSDSSRLLREKKRKLGVLNWIDIIRTKRKMNGETPKRGAGGEGVPPENIKVK